MGAAEQDLLLYRELCGRLDRAGDDETLIRLIGGMLRSLLRRKGDGEFLALVQDALIEGLAYRDLAGKKDLAREVLAVVLEKRPEIAMAWQILHGDDGHPERRRAADLAEASPPEPAPPPRPPKPPYAHDRAEAVVAAYVGEVLARRLAMFRVAEPVFPSAAYRHEQPFFLFSPAFAPVACAYVAEVVMVECRDALERHVYRHLEPRFGADDGALKAVLDEARPQIWKILAERLTKLAGHHRNAEAKLDAARAGGGDGPEFAEVEVPVTHPRVFRVLGVEFVLGNRTTTRKMKVRVKASTELDRDEMRALDLITRLGDMAADEGVELPDSCDFLFLRSLLEFDARKYGQTQKELVALAGHEETTRAYLFERLKAVEEHYSNTLADVMVLMLFAAGAECRFGFKEMLDVCLGTAKSMDAVATQRPFLVAEIGRRPRELAFQLREALRRRYDENTVAAATRQLLEVWEAMPRSRFERDLDAALTVFSAFPVAFAGDPDEPALSEIGHILHRALAGKSPEPRATIDAVVAAYAPLAQRLREAVRG